MSATRPGQQAHQEARAEAHRATVTGQRPAPMPAVQAPPGKAMLAEAWAANTIREAEAAQAEQGQAETTSPTEAQAFPTAYLALLSTGQEAEAAHHIHQAWAATEAQEAEAEAQWAPPQAAEAR